MEDAPGSPVLILVFNSTHSLFSVKLDSSYREYLFPHFHRFHLRGKILKNVVILDCIDHCSELRVVYQDCALKQVFLCLFRVLSLAKVTFKILVGIAEVSLQGDHGDSQFKK